MSSFPSSTNLSASDARSVSDTSSQASSVPFHAEEHFKASQRAARQSGRTPPTARSRHALANLNLLAERIDQPGFYFDHTQRQALEKFDILLDDARPALLHDPEQSRIVGQCLRQLPVAYQGDTETRLKTCLNLLGELSVRSAPRYETNAKYKVLEGSTKHINGTAEFVDGLVYHAKQLPRSAPMREQVKQYARRFGCKVSQIRPFGIAGDPPKALPQLPPLRHTSSATTLALPHEEDGVFPIQFSTLSLASHASDSTPQTVRPSQVDATDSDEDIPAEMFFSVYESPLEHASARIDSTHEESEMVADYGMASIAALPVTRHAKPATTAAALERVSRVSAGQAAHNLDGVLKDMGQVMQGGLTNAWRRVERGDWLKSKVLNGLRAQTTCDVEIGEQTLRPQNTLNDLRLTLHDVRLVNPQGASRPYAVQIQRLDLLLDMRKTISSQQAYFKNIQMAGVDVQLEKLDSGLNIGLKNQKQGEVPTMGFQLQDARLSYRSGESDLVLHIPDMKGWVEKRQTPTDQETFITAQGKWQWNQQASGKVQFETGPLKQPNAPSTQQTPFSISISPDITAIVPGFELHNIHLKGDAEGNVSFDTKGSTLNKPVKLHSQLGNVADLKDGKRMKLDIKGLMDTHPLHIKAALPNLLALFSTHEEDAGIS